MEEDSSDLPGSPGRHSSTRQGDSAEESVVADMGTYQHLRRREEEAMPGGIARISLAIESWVVSFMTPILSVSSAGVSAAQVRGVMSVLNGVWTRYELHISTNPISVADESLSLNGRLSLLPFLLVPRSLGLVLAVTRVKCLVI